MRCDSSRRGPIFRPGATPWDWESPHPRALKGRKNNSRNNISTNQDKPAHAGRDAFTLLEVIFALVISLVLLGALMGAMDLYRRLSSTGRDRVERAQIERALLRMIELDVRSCVLQTSQAGSGSGTGGSSETGSGGSSGGTSQTGTPSGGEGSSTGEQTELVQSTVDSTAAFSGQAMGIVGDPNTLIIHTGRPTRDAQYYLQTPAQPMLEATGPLLQGNNDQKAVAYFLAVRGGDGLRGAAAQYVAQTQGPNIVGLARLEGDRLAMQFADRTADLDTLARATELLAEEISFLQFRYFDGIQWYDIWDSSAYGRLPNAVEVTIGFRGDAASERAAGGVPSEVTRYVISIPTAEPAVLNATSQTF